MEIELNGANYYVNIQGIGSPVLMLHGFTGSSENWLPIAANWAGKHRLVMPDLLGHGRTAAPAEPERYHMEQAAADLNTLLDVLEIKHAHILGYSMGGRLALYFATHYPQRVHNLVLESSSPGLEIPEERAKRRRQDNALAERIEAEGIEAFVNYWESLPLWQSQQMLSLGIRQALHEKRLNNRPLGLANSLRGMGTGMQPSLWNQLSTLPHHTLLLTGLLDKKFVEINKQMSKLIPTAALQIVSHVGHTIHLEQPEVYSKTVLSFLYQHPLVL